MSHRAVKYRVTLTTAEPNKPRSGRNPPPLIYYGAPIIVARLCNVNGTTVMHASNPTRFVPVASAYMRGMKTRPLWQKPVQSSLNVCGLSGTREVRMLLHRKEIGLIVAVKLSFPARKADPEDSLFTQCYQRALRLYLL